MPTMSLAPRRSPIVAPEAAPLLPAGRSGPGGAPPRRAWRAAAPPLTGADPAPRWTLRRLVGWVSARFGTRCCRETIRAALHRLGFSWKTAKKLLGRADPEKRRAFLARLGRLLAGARRGRHLLVYWDEAHIHQDADLGYGWAERGRRFWVAASSPGLAAKLSFSGLYLYNEGTVRLWPSPRANSTHTIEALRRWRAERPDCPLLVLWDGAAYHRATCGREAAAALDIKIVPLPGTVPTSCRSRRCGGGCARTSPITIAIQRPRTGAAASPPFKRASTVIRALSPIASGSSVTSIPMRRNYGSQTGFNSKTAIGAPDHGTLPALRRAGVYPSASTAATSAHPPICPGARTPTPSGCGTPAVLSEHPLCAPRFCRVPARGRPPPGTPELRWALHKINSLN
jgi:hypothetical protein